MLHTFREKVIFPPLPPPLPPPRSGDVGRVDDDDGGGTFSSSMTSITVICAIDCGACIPVVAGRMRGPRSDSGNGDGADIASPSLFAVEK